MTGKELKERSANAKVVEEAYSALNALWMLKGITPDEVAVAALAYLSRLIVSYDLKVVKPGESWGRIFDGAIAHALRESVPVEEKPSGAKVMADGTFRPAPAHRP